MRKALQHHWPEYGMEAVGLGVFMLSACVCVALLQHPASPVTQVIQPPLLRRFLIGLAMGLTAISIIYSPWGKQSGAHLNPSVTLTFFRLGKVALWDTLWYVLAQFVGGILGGARGHVTTALCCGPHGQLCRHRTGEVWSKCGICGGSADLVCPHVRGAPGVEQSYPETASRGSVLASWWPRTSPWKPPCRG